MMTPGRRSWQPEVRTTHPPESCGLKATENTTRQSGHLPDPPARKRVANLLTDDSNETDQETRMKNQARSAPPNREWRYKTGGWTIASAGYACAIAILLVASLAWAQDVNESVTIEDLGFTQRLIAGARPTALAGAYVSLSDDVHSLIYNPAGLVGVSGVEFDLGFQHQRSNLENVFYGTPSDVELSVTKLDDIALAYAVPTVRGRLVLAGGVYRVYSSEIDILNRGFNRTTSTNDDYLLQQSGSTYSYNFGGAIDLAPKLSVGANLFFLHGKVNALTQFTFEVVPRPTTPGELASETLIDDARVDVRGYGALIGFLYQPSEALGFGLSVGTPTPINIRGDAVQDDALYFSTPPDSFFTSVFAIDTDYQLPFYIEGGVSLNSKLLLLTAQLGFSNWSEVEINDLQVKDRNLRPIFRDVVDLRAGAELRLGSLSLRGGYAYTPYPLEYLQADRIEGDQLEEATIDTELQSLTAGIGLLLADVFRLDASLEYQLGERSIPTLIDKREMYRFVFAGSVAY
jgi:long-subunit fatty acid transport protein